LKDEAPNQFPALGFLPFFFLYFKCHFAFLAPLGIVERMEKGVRKFAWPKNVELNGKNEEYFLGLARCCLHQSGQFGLPIHAHP